MIFKLWIILSDANHACKTSVCIMNLRMSRASWKQNCIFKQTGNRLEGNSRTPAVRGILVSSFSAFHTSFYKMLGRLFEKSKLRYTEIPDQRFPTAFWRLPGLWREGQKRRGCPAWIHSPPLAHFGVRPEVSCVLQLRVFSTEHVTENEADWTANRETPRSHSDGCGQSLQSDTCEFWVPVLTATVCPPENENPLRTRGCCVAKERHRKSALQTACLLLQAGPRFPG